MPFQAVSTKASNDPANLAYASIFVGYLLFVHHMYMVMGGEGGMRDGSTTPQHAGNMWEEGDIGYVQ